MIIKKQHLRSFFFFFLSVFVMKWGLVEKVFAEKKEGKQSSGLGRSFSSSEAAKDDGEYVIKKEGNKTIKYKKKATYDFEGTSIEGAFNKPSGSYISNIKDVKARSIIRIRDNFDLEVIDSARLFK